MGLFIQLSDLHIASNPNADNNKATDTIVAFIKERYKNTEKPVVLITGDVVDNGLKSEYKEAFRLLKPLKGAGFRLLITPGNHDYEFLGNIPVDSAVKNYDRYILRELMAGEPESYYTGEAYPLVSRIGDVLYVGLDSCATSLKEPFNFARGKVGKIQRQRLQSIWMRNTQLPINRKFSVVVYFHHHPFYRDSPVAASVMEMEDANKVMGMLSNWANCVCFGHRHKSQVWRGEAENRRYGIDLIVASGRTTDGSGGHYTFREIETDPNQPVGLPNEIKVPV